MTMATATEEAGGPQDGTLAQFESFLRAATEEMPTQELKDQVRAGLTRRHENPPLQVIEECS